MYSHLGRTCRRCTRPCCLRRCTTCTWRCRPGKNHRIGVDSLESDCRIGRRPGAASVLTHEQSPSAPWRKPREMWHGSGQALSDMLRATHRHASAVHALRVRATALLPIQAFAPRIVTSCARRHQVDLSVPGALCGTLQRREERHSQIHGQRAYQYVPRRCTWRGQ